MAGASDTFDTLDIFPDRMTESGEGPVSIPRLEILFHSRLERIGETTEPFPGDDGRPAIVGRNEPPFAALRGERRPLEDRFISREHFSLAWLAKEREFVITPSSTARQRLSLISTEPSATQPVDAPTRAPAGSVLAVGNRLLLLLGCGKQRDPRASRLNMVGESEAAWRLRERIQTVARFHETILILGDTGTGKELVANAIDRLGGAVGEFVALNMGGLDAGTAGSELFGHVKGAFTGAHRDHVGAFEAARKGTLFLDEIGELPLDLQKKLLRVLEERQYFPVGGRVAKEANCRVIAATNSHLDVEVMAGRFRRDLFERLNALSVQMPSLHQRWEDVPRLFCHFLSERTREQPSLRWLWQGTVESSTPIPMEFIIELMRRPWPGNVRELRNVVTATAAANLTPGQFIRPGETTPIPSGTLTSGTLTSETLTSETRAESGKSPRLASAGGLPLTLPTPTIEAALRACRGNVRASADLLGCSRHQLYRWMKARSLDITQYRDEPGEG